MSGLFMLPKTVINIAGNSYIAELSDEGIVTDDDGFHAGLLFSIRNKDKEKIGQIKIFVSDTATITWGNSGTFSHEDEVNLILRIMPSIRFAANLHDFKTNPTVKLKIMPTETTYDEKLRIQYLRCNDSPEDLVNHLLFEDEVNEVQLEKDILTYLFEQDQQNRTLTHTYTMAKVLFANPDIVFRCLRNLKARNLVDGEKSLGTPGLAYSDITTPGIQYVRSKFKEIFAGTGVFIVGDYTEGDQITNITNGNNNQNIIKSTVHGSVNMNQIYGKVDELKTAIDQEYTGIDKSVIIGEVEKIKTLAAEKENYPKIRKLLVDVLSVAGDVAKISLLGGELIKIFSGGAA